MNDTEFDKMYELVEKRLANMGLTANKSTVRQKVVSIISMLVFLDDEGLMEAREAVKKSVSQSNSELLKSALDAKKEAEIRLNGVRSDIRTIRAKIETLQRMASSIQSADIHDAAMSDILSVYTSALDVGIKSGVSKDVASKSASYVAWASAHAPSLDIQQGGQ